MKHEAKRVNNLMYNGCEAHWQCIHCGKAVPFHCYSKAEFEQQCCDCHKINCDDCEKKGNTDEQNDK